MKSAFGLKRKPRKIEVDDDNEASSPVLSSPTPERPAATRRRPFKNSSLRQSIPFDDDEGEDNGSEEQIQSAPKPTIGRTDSLKKKKKPLKSRLSFGPGEIISGDDAEALEDEEIFTPKRTGLGRRVVESNAVRRSLGSYQIPLRSGDDDEERPTYSKDYLNELKSSTPNTPKDMGHLRMDIDEDEGLDESELAGAMIVDTTDHTTPASIPTESEIREKKVRRARLAREQDFISLDSADDDSQVLELLPRKKEPDTRLVREDEDLGEGFDEFVDDGRISLGKKQEREAKRKQRKQMAELIHAAEGTSSEDSDDSERERQAEYEAAQTRAGMDGLSKPDMGLGAQAPPKILPIPSLSECLQRLQTTMAGMERELKKRMDKMVALQAEKVEILAREEEVQKLLKEAGERFAAMRTGSGLGLGGVDSPAELMDVGNGVSVPTPLPFMVDRGLESFGNTPVKRSEVEDVG